MTIARYSASPRAVMAALFRHRGLVRQMVKREVSSRYRGSFLGIFWSFINPLLMLGLYSFVFTVVFQPKWQQQPTNSQGEYVLILFCGLIFHGFLAEILQRSPIAVVSNPNFVRKVMFPLEILPFTIIGSALFHLMISTGVLLLFSLAVKHSIPWTLCFYPLILLPLMLFACGASWMLASLGVYLRDIAQIMGLCITVLLFMSPILFPSSALPEAFRPYLYLNPLSFIVEQMREIIIWGRIPYWRGLMLYSLCGIIVMWIGFWWFQKTRKGFADVL